MFKLKLYKFLGIFIPYFKRKYMNELLNAIRTVIITTLMGNQDNEDVFRQFSIQEESYVVNRTIDGYTIIFSINYNDNVSFILYFNYFSGFLNKHYGNIHIAEGEQLNEETIENINTFFNYINHSVSIDNIRTSLNMIQDHEDYRPR